MAVCGLAFATVFRMSLETADPALDSERAHIVQLARDRPSSALEIAVPPGLQAVLFPELRDVSITSYRGAMGIGVLIALAGALVSFFGMQNQQPVHAKRDS